MNLTKTFIVLIIASVIFAGSFINQEISLDSELIIKPLEAVNSPSDYFKLFNNGKIADFQPIRDLLHLIDIKITKLTGFKRTSLFTNFLIFLATTYVLFQFLSCFFRNKLSFIGTLLFSVHPIIIHVYTDPAQKKHILSLLFLLLTLKFIYKKNEPKKALVSYILLLCSQPINALIPPYYFLQVEKDNFRDQKKLLMLSSFAAILVFFLAVNFSIYGIFEPQRVQAIPDLDLLNLVGSIGLFIRQIIFPFWFSTYYDLLKNINFIFAGIGLLFLFTSFLKKKTEFIKFIIPIFLIFMTLYGIKSNVYNLYFYNSYLLTPLIFSICMLLSFLEKFPYKKIATLSYLLASLFFCITLFYSSKRTNKYDLYTYQVTTEANCRQMEWLTVEAIKRAYTDDVYNYSRWWIKNDCAPIYNQSTFWFIQAHYVVENLQISFAHKLKYIDDIFSLELDRSLLKLIVLKRENRTEELLQELKKLKQFEYNSIFLENSYIIREVISVLKDSKLKNEILSQIAEIKKKPIKFSVKKL